MDLSKIPLERFAPRALNLLGNIFGGGDVRVLLSTRAERPVTVLLDTSTVILHPHRAGLYDLAIGSRLLRHRRERRQGPQEPERLDRWLTLKARRKWGPQAQADLRRQFPGIERLPGRLRPGTDWADIEVSDRRFRRTELPPPIPPDGKPVPPGQRRTTTAPLREVGLGELAYLPEVEITGEGDDFAWLTQALENGAITPRVLPTLEELPFLRLPFRVCSPEISPTLEWFREQLDGPGAKDIVASLIKCRTQSSVVREERKQGGRATSSGVHLDPNRLVGALISARVGLEPRLFRNPSSSIEPVFDPAEHLAWFAIDLNCLERAAEYSDAGRGSVLRFLALILTVVEQLGVDCVVIGFADRMLTLSDGTNVCLHLTTTLKQLEGPFGDAFWSKLEFFVRTPPQFPGAPGSFHPLAAHEIGAGLNRVARESEHSYRTLHWWAPRPMGWEFPRYREPEFCMRMADFVEGVFSEIDRGHAGTFNTDALFLPSCLKEAAQPGSRLTRAHG